MSLYTLTQSTLILALLASSAQASENPTGRQKWASWVAIGVVILLVVLFLGSILIARLVGAIGGLLSPVRSSRIRPAERMWYGPENVA